MDSVHVSRIVEAEMDELATQLPAVALEGPKGVGKTATAARRAGSVFRLDDPAQQEIARADPSILLSGNPPILLDEWQHVPEIWDAVRRAVDADATPNHFLLAGSATPVVAPTHSGAGRIVRVRMRPLSLAERWPGTATVSLQKLLDGGCPPIDGQSTHTLVNYAREIVSSGFPAIRPLSGRALRAQLDGYLSRIVDRDFVEQGHAVRRPDTLRRWMSAYAAATATITSFEKIRSAAAGGESDSPSKVLGLNYRDVLQRLWIVDPVPGWLPTRNQLARVAQAPKHHLADPALAARLLGIDEHALLTGATSTLRVAREGTLLGSLFESLVTQSVRVYAQHAEAQLRHLRSHDGRHEIDLIVERADQRVLAIEVKLSATVDEDDVRHLLWLEEQLGDDVLDMVIVTTGTHAYRRADGVAVVPASLLGP